MIGNDGAGLVISRGSAHARTLKRFIIPI